MSSLKVITNAKFRPGQGLCKRGDREYVFFGKERYPVFKNKKEWKRFYKQKPKPTSKTCSHKQWIQSDLKTGPVLNCGACGVKAQTVQVITARPQNMVQRFPRTAQNLANWAIQRAVKKINKISERKLMKLFKVYHRAKGGTLKRFLRKIRKAIG